MEVDTVWLENLAVNLIWRFGGMKKSANIKSHQLPIIKLFVGGVSMHMYQDEILHEGTKGIIHTISDKNCFFNKTSKVQCVNSRVKRSLEESQKSERGKYNEYTAEERAHIGKFVAENGPAKAVRHFSDGKLPESTARRFKLEYLSALKDKVSDHENGVFGDTPPEVTVLPTKAQGRPLVLGKELDNIVQEYIESTRKAKGVVNTVVVIAGATGIAAAKDPGLLFEHGGHIKITKAWAKSVLQQVGYVKRKCSNAGKVSVERFEELKDEFLADIKAEVVMNDIPIELVFNWDQTGVQLVPTGEWTMHHAKAKVIPIAHSDDKRQITAVLAASLIGEYLSPQLIYKGKTERCHPKVAVPDGWDAWHSDNHWSTEAAMKRYIEKIIVPFVTHKRLTLNLKATHPALAIFDCFRGQTTPAILDLLKMHNIRFVIIPANCMDKLQPMDVSINKPLKDEMKSRFQLWYASEVQKQLKV